MTAAEFFSQFDIARRRAGHGGTTSDLYLIELLERNLNKRLVVKIRRAGQVHQKSQQQTQTPAQTPVTQKDSTGVTFGGAGQAMDIDKAKALGLCF